MLGHRYELSVRGVAGESPSRPTLRSDPSQTAVLGGPGQTASTPLRISTHLFHSRADIDRLVSALLAVVPHP